MRRTAICTLELWLASYLAAIIGFDRLIRPNDPEQVWLRYPGTIGLAAAIFAALVLEAAAFSQRVQNPFDWPRRLILYICSVVVGVIIYYGVSAEKVGPTGFRFGVLAITALPLVAWLNIHVGKQHRIAVSTSGKVLQLLMTGSFVALVAWYASAAA